MDIETPNEPEFSLEVDLSFIIKILGWNITRMQNLSEKITNIKRHFSEQFWFDQSVSLWKLAYDQKVWF